MALLLVILAQLTETVEVHILEIEVSVLDKAGAPVAGLKQEDFEVTVEGKSEPVTNFYMVRRGEVVDETLPGDDTSAPAPAQIVPTRLVLFVDDLHLHQRSKKRAVETLKKFVEETMDDATTAMVVRWNGSLNVLVPATKNRQALLDAIALMAKEPARMRAVDSERRTLVEMRDSMPPDAWRSHLRNYAESQRNETVRTIAALSETARAVGGLEGRKVLLYVSEGLPLLAGWEMLALGAEGGGLPLEVLSYDLTANFRELTKYAQEAGVVFCPLDPSGPDGATFAVDVPNGNPNPAIIRENNFNSSTMVARETGGQFIHDTNQLDLALARLTDQVTTFYSLGVRAPGGKRGPFKVKVRVRNRPELRVATAPQRSVQSRDELVANAVRSHLYIREEANPLGAQLTVGTPRKDRGRCVVDVGVTVNSKNLTLIPIEDSARGEIAFHFALLDDRQQESPVRRSAKEVWPRAGAEVSQHVSLGVKPMKYVLSTALTDNVSGEASYLQREIDATACR